MLNYILLLVPFMVIFLIGSAFFREAFYKEKINGTFENLLATSLDIREIWISKIFVICTLSYLIFIIVSMLIFSSLLVLHKTNFLKIVNFVSIFNFFFVSPLFSFSILSLLGYLELFLKHVSQIALFMIFPLFFSIKFLRKVFVVNLKISFLIIIFALFIFAISYTLICFLKKEKIITNV